MVCCVVPVTVRPSHNWPEIAPTIVYVLSCQLTAVRLQLMLPVKLPEKSTVLCPCAQLPLPTTLNVEPTDENDPPPASVPPFIAPVVKVTEPREGPGAAETPLKLLSCEPNDETPEAETETVPNWFVRVIPSAQAAIGNANASNTRTTTRLILIPSQIFLLFLFSPWNFVSKV